MFPQDSQLIQITKFNGMYANGLPDECPPDHATDMLNMVTSRKGEITQRFGIFSNVGLTWSVVRMFASTISGVTVLLTLDPSGNLYAGTSSTPIYSDANMIDFSAINIYNKTYILPIVSTYTDHNGLLVYNQSTIRPALGLVPVSGATMTVSAPGSGNIPIGNHTIAVAYITDSGFTTKPGPYVSGVFFPAVFSAPGGTNLHIGNIPTGPTGTVARQILITQANLATYYYCPGGYINDNTTTSVTVNFFDTDLVLSADSLFDLQEKILPAVNFGGLYEYHGRMISFGQMISYSDLVYSAQSPNIALVSNAGDAESFDGVQGFIQIPTENDPNLLAGSFQINDNLYFTRCIKGIFQTVDNGGVPTSWQIVPIDYGIGACANGISVIQGNSVSATTLDTVILADISGLYLFNGFVQQIPLSYKITNLWDGSFSTHANSGGVGVYIDVINKLIYVVVPGTSTVLVGDYFDGLDNVNIKWTKFQFFAGANVQAAFVGDVSDGINCPRFTFPGIGNHGVFRLWPPDAQSYDLNSSIQVGISSYFYSYLAYFKEGQVNIFNAIRVRGKAVSGTANIAIQLINQDDTLTVTAPQFSLTATPGQDYLRQINFVNEKMTVQLLQQGSATGPWTLQRLDIMGNPLWPARPG